jgi:hypothetical protein
MANTKISALPSYTGTAADLRWFVMNNSGETETFKFSGYTAPYRWNSSTSGITEVNITKSSQFNTRGGTNTETANSYSNFVVGTGNTIGNSTAQHIIFGEGNTATGGGNSVGSFTFGRNNTITNANNRWGAIFGNGNSIGVTGYAFGDNNNSQGLYSFSVGTNITNAGENSLAIGDGNRVITNYNFSIGIDNDIENGNYNGMMGGQNGRNNSGSWNGFLGGKSNTNNTSSYGGFIGGESNTITGSGDRNVMVGGSGNTISGKTDVVMLGTSGRTASADNTTFVENIHTFRTPSTQVQPSLTGTTFTCNLDNGAKSQFYITGTSTINITNVRDGASFMIKTQTDGNYVMTWTATGGYTFVFEGGIKDPGNNVTDIFVFEVFGSVIYGNRRHNYS